MKLMGNLLDNAGKWSDHCVELSLVQRSGTLQMGVIDDGPGVADAEISKLGQRGLRLDEQTPGHGLGLAIVREIVERYGGTLRFPTIPERGFFGGGQPPKVSISDQSLNRPFGMQAIRELGKVLRSCIRCSRSFTMFNAYHPWEGWYSLSSMKSNHRLFPLDL